jgi:hypothetical protein
VLLLIPLLASVNVRSAEAQAVLDRIVGPTEFGDPVFLRGIDGQQLAILGRAAGVAIGFEGIVPVRYRSSIRATARPLRTVLDTLVHADPRYEWREDDGVIVVRPIAAWSDDSSALHAPIDALMLEDVTARDVLNLLAQMVGAQAPDIGHDTRRFSVQVRQGATWLEALNAIVRAHGTLTWTIAPLRPNRYDTAHPLAISLFVGGSGAGVGIPADAVLNPVASGRLGYPEEVGSPLPLLDRIVGLGRRNEPLVVTVISESSVSDLASAVGVPMGFEALPASAAVRYSRDGIPVTGMTLRNALNVLLAIDARYEWRDESGVVVLRPAKAWLDGDNPLFQLVPSVEVQDAPTSKVLGLVYKVLSGNRHPSGFPDTRTFSVDAPKGTLLDLLNAVVRAHGELAWSWAEIPPSEKDQRRLGYRHRLNFWLMRSGRAEGLTVP